MSHLPLPACKGQESKPESLQKPFWEGPFSNCLLLLPTASPAPGAAADSPAEELPGVAGGGWHARVLRGTPAPVPGTVLPRLGHLPYVRAGATH